MTLKTLSAGLLVAVASILLATSAYAQCACSVSWVIVPGFAEQYTAFTLNTPDGPLDYIRVYQGGPPATPHPVKHWCVCMNAAGETGPSEPPQNRSCQYYSVQISGSQDEDYVENEHCRWNPRPGEANCSPAGASNSCPML